MKPAAAWLGKLRIQAGPHGLDGQRSICFDPAKKGSREAMG
jgi:hypothetical protein